MTKTSFIKMQKTIHVSGKWLAKLILAQYYIRVYSNYSLGKEKKQGKIKNPNHHRLAI